MNVRRATEKDIPAILELLVQVDMVHHNGRPDLFKGPATKYNEEELKVLLADEEKPVFVCVDEEGRVLGHAFCMEQQDICVHEDARGKHVGKALYEAVVEYAKAHDFYNITLNVWACNPGAMKFYEAMGTVPQKICMEKVLK